MTALVPTLALAVGLIYVACLWWFLRREEPIVLLTLVLLCMSSLLLRVIFSNDYPAGFDDDELSKFWGAIRGWKDPANYLFHEDGSGWPVLLHVMFVAPLEMLFGASRWALRGYSLVTTVLSTPLAYAAGRRLGISLAGSLAAACLTVVLPWSIFFGRVANGGELLFHGMLLIAALGTLVRRRGTWVEVAIASFALSALLYDYGCGRPWLLLPFVAAVLARDRQRWLCLLIPFLAVALFAPQLWYRFDTSVGAFGVHINTDLAHSPWQVLGTTLPQLFYALTGPWAADYFLSVRSAAMHPIIVLLFAAVGLLGEWRIGLFLLAAFGLAVTPVLLTDGSAPSVHRMLLAFPILALLAGRGVDRLPRQPWRALAALVLCVVGGVQGVTLYFSPQFWGDSSRGHFDTSGAALNDALPQPVRGKLVATLNATVSQLRANVAETRVPLTPEEYVPALDTPVTYAFSREWLPLRPAYDALFGFKRVRPVANSFIVALEAGDWSWLRQHGWTMTSTCPDGERRNHVPFLYHSYQGFQFPCGPQTKHRWQGIWRGAAANLRFDFLGAGQVTVNEMQIGSHAGVDGTIAFHLEPGDHATLSILTLAEAPTVHAQLLEITRAGPRVPLWEMVDPAP